MLQRVVFFALVSFLCVSSASDVREGNLYSKGQILSRTYSAGSIYTSRRNTHKSKLRISEDNAQKLLEIANGPHNTPENVNQFTDSIINDFVRELLAGDGDPYILADRALVITDTGTLDLTIGQLQGLSTIGREGDATLTAVDCGTIITIPLTFRTIIARYNFLMQVGSDTVEGTIHSWLDDVTADYSATVPCIGGPITESSFVQNIGTLQSNILGTGLSDSNINLITDLTAELLIDTISEYSDSIAGGLLKNAITSLLS